MKFSYALIKKLVPNAPPLAMLADALNAHAFEVEEAHGDLLDINLPANRYSGSASHIGVAREAAAIFKRGFKSPVATIVNAPSNRGLLTVNVDDKELCSRYAARVFDVKHVGPSPAWMQKILKTCGLKPINNIVDLMNYVMLEVGQPLHAFDYDLLSPKDKNKKTIIVRRAKRGEHIETLDGQRLKLDTDALVIADGNPPTGGALAIAGIKGGLNSGVSRSTKRIVVEAANFDSVNIYTTSRKLKLVTDAALRFSHGMSPSLVDWGLDRATALLREAGASLVDSVDRYPRPVGDEVIEFSVAAYEKLIGAPLTAAQAKKYFTALGFSIETAKPKDKDSVSGEKFLVRVPSWRNDIEEPEDLIEEVVRLEGLNALRSEPPQVSIRPATEEDTIILKDRVRNVLVNLQMDEICSGSFVGGKDVERARATDGIFEHSQELVELENPLAEDKRYLRPSLVPLLLARVAENSRLFADVRLFEVGKVFSRLAKGVEEQLVLGAALARKKDPKVMLEMKGLVSTLAEDLGLGGMLFGPSQSGLRIELDHRVVGALRLVHLEKGWLAAVGELNLGKMLHFVEEEREFEPLSRFPAVLRDISLLVRADVRIGDILEQIERTSSELVEDVDLVDEYVDKALGDGKQSITFRLVFQSRERTLSDEEVNAEMEKIVAELKHRFRAEVR